MNSVTIAVGTANPSIRNLIAETLSGEFNLEFYANGISTLEAVRSQKPRAVILDLILPGMDGIQVCRALKDDDETRDIPVVIVSSLLAREHSIQAGADAFLHYPFQGTELRNTISRVLNSSHERR